MNVRVRTFRMRGGYAVDVVPAGGAGASIWAGWSESEREAFVLGCAAAENRGHVVSEVKRAS